MSEFFFRSLSGILIVFLVGTSIPGHTQELKGSFGSTIHFYEKCGPFVEEIQKEAYEVGWRGERISKTMVLWSEKENVENVRFHISDFIASNDTIPSESLFLRKVGYVKSDIESRPCQGYANRDQNQFIELGDILTSTIDSTIHHECPSVHWLTMDIPATASPGLYAGTVRISANESVLLELNLAIQVIQYTLPSADQWDFHLDLWQFPCSVVDRYNESQPDASMQYWSDEHFKILERKYWHLGQMGQKVITAHIKEGALGSPSMIQWIMHSDSTWTYNYQAFDRYVSSLLNWGINKQISCQSPVGWNSDEIPYWCESAGTLKELHASIGSELYRDRWNHFLDAFKVHLDEMQWFEKAVLYLDEVDPERLNWIIDFIKTNDPDWKIGLAGFHTPTDFTALNVYDMSLMVGITGNPIKRDQHGISTFYTSCNPVSPNNFITGNAEAAQNVWIGWHASQMGYQGFLRWAYDYWRVTDPTEQRIGAYSSGDFSLSYRSSNALDMEIFPSVRLALIREGIEDFEKISILKRSLEQSDSPYDLAALKRLNRKIDEFNFESSSGGEVSNLVQEARQLINDIATNSK